MIGVDLGTALAAARAAGADTPYSADRVRAAARSRILNHQALAGMNDADVVPALEEAVPGISGREMTDALATMAAVAADIRNEGAIQ